MKVTSLLFLVRLLCLAVLMHASAAADDDDDEGISDLLEFTRDSYNATIPENSLGKTYVTPSEKMGIFITDPSLVVRFKIISGEKERFFKAESRQVGDFCFLLVRTRADNHAVLNREYQDEYRLKIRATVTSQHRHKVKMKARTEVIVKILDTNDLNPLFYPTRYDITIPEDTPLHKSILKVSAFDPDIGVNGEIYYSFVQPTLLFAIHPTMGTVSLTRPLNYQEAAFHSLQIAAMDRGPRFRAQDTVRPSSMAELHVNVMPVNHHAPEIFIVHFLSVNERTSPHVYAIVRVTDKDHGMHGEIQNLEIVDGDPRGLFRIVAGAKLNEFNVEIIKPLEVNSAQGGYNLTLKATDRGSPPKSTLQVLRIRPTDSSEHFPTFERDQYSVEIDEVVPVGTPLILLHVTGTSHHSDLYYNIDVANDVGTFSINHRTGLISTARQLDRETVDSYVLHVSVVDQGSRGFQKKGKCTVTVRVLDANDNSPEFNMTDTTVVFEENKPIGNVVCTVSAYDIDAGENGYVTYSLANLNHIPFSIDHFTGDIRTTQVLDYETMRREYRLKVRASDWGMPFRRESEMELFVKLKDVNDHRPQFEKVDCIGYLSKKAPIGTEIMTLSALDFDAGSIVSYRLVPSNDDPCFKLDASSGVLRLMCNISEYPLRERVLNVSATDGQFFSDVMEISIKVVSSSRNHRLTGKEALVECQHVGVADRLQLQISAGEKNNRMRAEDVTQPTPSIYRENRHTPEFLSNLSNEVTVNESLPIGFEILMMKAKDKDPGYNGQLVYVISSGNEDSCFKIDTYSGALTVIGEIDREKTSKYILNITVSDLGQPPKSSFRPLVVHVRDINDNAPMFEKAAYNFVISEDSQNGSSVVRLRATDRDTDINAELRYYLVTDTRDFYIHPRSGLLTVNRELDRERTDQYKLLVRVVDGSPENPLSSTTVVNIRVLDVNDNTPTFGLPSYLVRVREDLPLGTVIMSLSAHDPDLGEGGSVTYELTSGGEGKFTIDELMGTVRLADRLDFEEKQLFNLSIIARDGGHPSLSSSTYLLVEVEDVNENVHAPHFSDFVAEGKVPENQPENTFVMQVHAVDEDVPGLERQVIYSIRDGDGMGLFSIDENGIIRTRAVLDRETSRRYWLTVFAQDRGAVPLSSRLEVYIEVLDENDNTPLTVEPAYYPMISENSPPNSTVVKLDAFDLDDNPDSNITYKITAGDPQGFFTINPDTGLIVTTNRKLNREVQEEHVLEVTVSDNGNPPLSSATRVAVKVTDLNDNDPKFLQSRYRCYIPEMDKQESDIQLCQVIAMDPDAGPNGDIDYSIINGSINGRFKIHPKTGVLYSQKAFLPGAEYTLTVRAVDNGRPQRSAITHVLLIVQSISRDSSNAPVVHNPDMHVNVTESDPVGHLVALIEAEDVDGDRIWYSIVGGNEGDVFIIEREGGGVRIVQQLDWESQHQYELNISITDGVHFVFTKLHVSVVDTNDHQPKFSEHAYTVDVSESITAGTEILQIEAFDRDEDKRLFFSLYNSVSPNSLSKFHMDSTKGIISIARPLDHEATRSHILTAMVKDLGTPSKKAFARVMINVQDHNDHAPEFLSPIFEGRVYETAAVGSSVLQVMAVDRDKGTNAKITYAIASGNIGNAFSIDPVLGIVYVEKELNRHSMPEYFLVVRATDQGLPARNSTVTVHVDVTIANNAPPKFEKKEYSAEIRENSKIGEFVVAVLASSRSSVYYEIVSGNRNADFTVNPNSGIIHTNNDLDYEKIKFYNLTLCATNMVGANATVFVSVHVIDVNDNPPVFEQSEFYGQVSELVEPGSLVFTNESVPLVVVAKDKDSDLNALLEYKIVEKSAQKFFRIDSNTGAISTVVPLDHEEISEFHFSIQVVDRGTPRLFAETPAKVHINVIDANDSPPQFEKRVYKALLLLPTYKGVSVVTVKAIDPDTQVNGVVKYSIVSGNTGDKFAIDPLTGQMLVKNAENLRENYELIVSASDGEFEASTKVAISVEETRNSGLRFTREKYLAKVMENVSEVQKVTVVSVLGSALEEVLSFTMLNPSDMFTIGKTSGVILTTGKEFDRETTSLYTLVIEVRSRSSEFARVAHVLVEVTVEDVNDNAPVFVNLPYYMVVPAESQSGKIVGKVSAIDKDAGSNGQIRYEIIKGGNGTFRMDSKKGEIYLKQALGKDSVEYELIVSATDDGKPPMNSTANISIKVINRAMPTFNKQFYSVSIPENQSPNKPVLTIEAESPQGRQLIYSIVKGNEQEEFMVDFNTDPARSNGPCILYVAEELDYETTQSYHLTVRATDSVSGVFSEIQAEVKVLDVNDNPPMFTQPSYNASVSESAPFGTSILQVHASDRDSGINQQVQYHIMGNSSLSYFLIEPQEGIVFIKQYLDHEQQPMHHFVVVATDEGTPPQSSTAHVWVTVEDVNDNPPKFDHAMYTSMISEHAQRGQFVTRVVASDADISDQSRLMYSVVGGNELQAFTIEQNTGIITISNVHQFLQQSSYSLNVSVSDGVYSSHCLVNLRVVSANRRSPIFSRTVYEVTLEENMPVETFVITVTATDGDRGEYGHIRYSILSEECQKFFHVDPVSGKITTRQVLDREKRHLYEMPIVAMDGGGRLGFTTVRVSVTDVNDNAPSFSVGGFRANIPSIMAVGTTIAKAHATDADTGKAAIIEYAIYPKSNTTGFSEIFGVTHDSGEIYLKKEVTGLANHVFQFFVRARDQGDPSLESAIPIDIAVIDSYEAFPRFERHAYEFFVSESVPIGTIISTLNITHTEKMLYSFVPAPEGSDAELYASMFSIREEGKIVLISELDREERAFYALTVKAETTKSPSLTTFANVIINVMDENDNIPQFESTAYRAEIAENSPAGATVLRIMAHDTDLGQNAEVTYSFGPDSVDAVNTFHLDTHMGWITTLVPLDRETMPFYNFTVLAKDSGSQLLFSTATVLVKVRDYNDNPPLFKRKHYDTAIYEDALPETGIITLEVSDADDKSNTRVEFYITNGNSQDHFQIRHTGELYVNKPLDRERTPSYLLEVTSTDGRYTSKTEVAIDVLDANDNAPICLKSKYTELVSESILPNTFILKVEATDVDEDQNAQLEFSLSGKGSDDFTIDAVSGFLKTAKLLDRETQSRYVLLAHVQDREHEEWECVSTVEILLSDVNDNAPSFTQDMYSVAVPEDSDVGTLIAKIHATDKDLGNGRKISYSFIDSAHGHFTMDEMTGIIQLSKPLDREEQAMYNLTVQARDHGTPQLSSLATVLVIVQDVNDNPPEFSHKFHHASVVETAIVGTEVVRVLATSRDSGINAEITYSLIGGNEQGTFSVHPKSGIISVAKQLDYESVQEYFLTVQAQDGGTPPLSNKATVNISITDANDNAPVFHQPYYHAVIREDAVVGDKIIQVGASDADSYTNAHLTYSVLDGNRHGQFVIDSETGLLSLALPLDREMVSSYILEVGCADGGIPPLSSTVLVTIEVSDVNDNAPQFSQANYTAFIQEGKMSGFTVLKFTVTDPDASPNGGPFVFDIVSGNKDQSFRLVQQDGTLRTAAEFNHKFKSEYVLQVRVSDSGTPQLSSVTWVTIKVIEESQYPPVVTPLDVTVSSYLDSFPGGIMGRIHATDQDPYDKLSFDIVSSHDNLFSIDHEDGTLVALPGLDVGTYALNISVTDGKFTAFTKVQVDVTMVTEDAVQNSIGLRINDVTPEDFLLTYRKGFLRALRNVFNVRIKDIEIISLQPTAESLPRTKRNPQQDLDILFSIRKGSNGFYPPKLLQSKVKDNKEMLETTMGVKILEVMEDRCTASQCVQGTCIDHIILDDKFSVSVTTDAFSYVSPQHYRKLECLCEPGYGGTHCDHAINECARKPCPSHHICIPVSSPLGYSCQCPRGKTGPSCNRDKMAVCHDSSCYEEKSPISFEGSSYARYTLMNPIDRHLRVKLHLRTRQPSGNIMYAAGARDYSIVEIVSGLVQYRFDCGSGEGLVRVERVPVNDGNWHEVRVERRGNTAEVVIDNKFRGSGAAPGIHDILNLDGNDVYFGAEVRPRPVGGDDIRMGFLGCMDDIQVDGSSLPLHITSSNAVATLRRFANVEFHCHTVTDPGICGTHPCLNGGTCQSTGDAFVCLCPPRFLGPKCEIDTSPCDSSPCLNGGTCLNQNGEYRCECPSGLSGKRCDYGRYCNPNPCRNKGLCEEGTFGPTCKCLGFHGDFCEFDINECQTNPCASGSTCINIPGSFQCLCRPNTTGPLCTEYLTTAVITSSHMNITIEEIFGITVLVLFLLMVALTLAFCCRYRQKRRRQRPNNEPRDDPGANEFLLKKPMLEKDNLNRISKLSNLEVSTTFATPPLPPRPASYTPSSQDHYSALNNFDTVRSYGSAADDLETIPRYTNEFIQNLSKAPAVSVAPSLPPPPPSNSPSDTDSINKRGWEKNSCDSKEKLFDEKIQNDLKQNKPLDMLPSVIALNSMVAPVPPSRGPSSLGVPSVLSLNSVDDLPGYHWDCSDWATQKPLANITQVSLNEFRDTSSIQSTESNSLNSQIELLPTVRENIVDFIDPKDPDQDVDETHAGSEDLDLPESEYVGDSEYNDNEFEDHDTSHPDFEKLLGVNDLDFADDGVESLPSSPLRYQRHPNQYLPPHSPITCHSSRSWSDVLKKNGNLSDDEAMVYKFPTEGGRGYRFTSKDDGNDGFDAMSMSLGYTSTNGSCSDLSGQVCEIDDSENNMSDTDPESSDTKPTKFLSLAHNLTRL